MERGKILAMISIISWYYFPWNHNQIKSGVRLELLESKHKVLLALGFYVSMTFLAVVLYRGPLFPLFQNQPDISRSIVWNDSVCLILVLITYVVTKRFDMRKLPITTISRRSIIKLIVFMVVYAMLVEGFWLLVKRWTTSGTLRTLMNTINSHLGHIAVPVKQIIDNAVLGGFEITVIIVVLALFFFGRSRWLLLRIEWRDVLVLCILIVISTFVTILGNRVFLGAWNVQQEIPTFNIVSVSGLAAQFFINGFVEEVAFRGYILSSILAIIRYPFVSIWISAVVFDLSHIPQGIYDFHMHAAWWQWLLFAIFPLQPNGWLYGFMFYRMKSALPVAIFHSYTTLWATYFFS